MDRDDVVMWLPALPESVAIARGRVRRFTNLPPATESAVALLVSELVTIALRNGPETPDRQIELRLARGEDVVTVHVRRPGLELRTVPQAKGPADLLGRVLLDRVAERWGEQPGELWFEIGMTQQPDDAPAGARSARSARSAR